MNLKISIFVGVIAFIAAAAASSIITNIYNDGLSINSTKLIPPFDIFKCCSEAYGSCYSLCKKIDLTKILGNNSIIKEEQWKELRNSCLPRQNKFWDCLSHISKALQQSQQWLGHHCCKFGISTRCRNICATSTSLSNLNANLICRRSDEQNMFSCLQAQESLGICCQKATTPNCMKMCRRISDFDYESQALMHICREDNTKIMSCIQTAINVAYTKKFPKSFLNNVNVPCNCHTHFVPVCANGHQFHSACLSKCFGYNDFEYGSCDNPCRNGNHNCSVNSKCIEHHQICLSSNICKQYKCVDMNFPCLEEHQAVCDTNNINHTSVCHLLHKNSNFLHWGNCFDNCERRNTVCGINGRTYENECTAWADFVTVDYNESCRELGHVNKYKNNHCRTVICPHLPSTCNIFPPLACCPLCGKAFYILYSQEQIDYITQSPDYTESNLITVQNILGELNGLLSTPECKCIGYLTVNIGIFAAIVPKYPRLGYLNDEQVQSCSTEADRISNIINKQSFKIMNNMILSSLTMTLKITERNQISNSNERLSQTSSGFLILVMGLFISITLFSSNI